MTKPYDATAEFAPFKRSENPTGRHPRQRKGATAKKNARGIKKAAVVVAPVKKGKKK